MYSALSPPLTYSAASSPPPMDLTLTCSAKTSPLSPASRCHSLAVHPLGGLKG